MEPERGGTFVTRRLSPLTPTAKLAKAARLSAEAAKLYAEASEELVRGAGPEPPPRDPPPLTEMDRARARRALRRMGRIT
jgi:hypothetical protein